jgi:SAM-dependent methyltransferase
MTNSRNSTERFSDRADAYSAHRPGYPPEVFDALFDALGTASELVVADAGAGTGISTNLLAKRVAQVIAIEPNAGMRERATSLPNVRWVDATGERTGLGDRAVDVACAFQAFHWFEVPVAYAEFLRIARRRIGLVQYERDESQAFSAAYAAMIRPYMLDDTETLRMLTLERFAELAGTNFRRTIVPSSRSLTLDGVIGRIDSSSYLPCEGPQAVALRAEARNLFTQFARDGFVEMAMNVYVLTVEV